MIISNSGAASMHACRCRRPGTSASTKPHTTLHHVPTPLSCSLLSASACTRKASEVRIDMTYTEVGSRAAAAQIFKALHATSGSSALAEPQARRYCTAVAWAGAAVRVVLRLVFINSLWLHRCPYRPCMAGQCCQVRCCSRFEAPLVGPSLPGAHSP